MVAKVYITNDTGLDFEKAKRFGLLCACTHGSVDVFHPERVQEQIQDALETFDAAKDYLLLAGTALPAAFAMAYLSLHADDGRNEDKVKIQLLMFDSRKRDYFVRTVEV